jgi:hypothetical protein
VENFTQRPPVVPPECRSICDREVIAAIKIYSAAPPFFFVHG